jgi:hypothetical protein
MPANEEEKVQRDWNFGVNLSGLNAPTGQGRDLVEGYFKALITDMYIKPDNPNRVIIRYQVTEGPLSGSTGVDGLNVPKSDEDNVRYYWRGLSESVGYGPNDLDNGEIALSRKAFAERTGHIYFQPKGEDRQYDRTVWLSPAEWAQQKQSFDLVAAKQKAQPAPAKGGAGSALGGDTPAISQPQSLGGSAPSGGSSPADGAGAAATTKSALLQQLGVQ